MMHCISCARRTCLYVTVITSMCTQVVDPAANLTFDLRLTDRQREDRAQVVLPYTQPYQPPQVSEARFTPALAMQLSPDVCMSLSHVL